MTFLEFLLTELLGPATYTAGNGESHWPCPRCENPRFHTRPVKAGMRDRFSCWACGWWGDEHDALKDIAGIRDYGERLSRLEQIRKQFKAAVTAGLVKKNRPGTKPLSFSSRGSGESKADIQGAFFSPETTAKLTDLLADVGDPISALKGAQRALTFVGRNEIHPQVLFDRCEHTIWVKEKEAEHMAECSDETCDWHCCRSARGEM